MTNLVEAREKLYEELRKNSCPKTHENDLITSPFKEASDHASERGAREIDDAFVSGRSRKCVRIRKAIERIDRGTYGICRKCGDEIAEPRLLADPAFENCVDCQEKLDREQQKLRPRTGTFATQPIRLFL